MDEEEINERIDKTESRIRRLIDEMNKTTFEYQQAIAGAQENLSTLKRMQRYADN